MTKVMEMEDGVGRGTDKRSESYDNDHSLKMPEADSLKLEDGAGICVEGGR